MRSMIIKALGLLLPAVLLAAGCQRNPPQRESGHGTPRDTLRLSDYLKLPHEDWKDGARERVQFYRAIGESTFAVFSVVADGPGMMLEDPDERLVLGPEELKGIGAWQIVGTPRRSPDRRHLALDVDGGLALFDLETRAGRRLGSDLATEPAWSADGARLYYVEGRIRSYDLATGKVSTLDAAPAVDFEGLLAFPGRDRLMLTTRNGHILTDTGGKLLSRSDFIGKVDAGHEGSAAPGRSLSGDGRFLLLTYFGKATEEWIYDLESDSVVFRGPHPAKSISLDGSGEVIYQCNAETDQLLALDWKAGSTRVFIPAGMSYVSGLSTLFKAKAGGAR